jgi:hypothetical protein
LGDYGLDDDDEELAVPVFTLRAPSPAAIIVETAVVEVSSAAASKRPVRKPVKSRCPARKPPLR